MSKAEDKTPAEEVSAAPAKPDTEEELYEEPPRMTVRDTVGVVVALVALLFIGWLGYLWLTPGKSMADAFRFGRGQEMASMDMGAGEQAADAAPSELRCAHCGMFADLSKSRIAAVFSDGSQAAFDSWGCAFGYAGDTGLSLESAQVVDYTGSLDEPVWLAAADATYLYDTAPVEGSMPPYVAAFADAETARSYMPDMGGELLGFAELQARWPTMEQPMGGALDEREHGAMTASGAAPDDGGDAMDLAGMSEHADATQEHETATMAAAPDQPHLHDHEFRCAYCGMFADRSPSQVVGYWNDGSDTHHDCWDCLFKYATDSPLQLDHALIKLYNSSLEQPEWIGADKAVYLFGTGPIRGSMPPFIAAFADHAAAEAAKAELGGEIMNYSQLKSHWDQG